MLWLVAMAVFMETLDSTIVNTALPSMATSLGESPLRMYTIVLAYSLTLAVLIPASGWLADRLGTRKVFCGAIACFTAGSLACASSQSLGQLIVARFLQGIGGSMMLPVGRLAVLRAFPHEQYIRAISFVAVPGLVGPLLGPTLGGTIVELSSWHWIFLINIPIGIGGFIASLKHMPNYQLETRTRFDLPGFVMLSISMVMMSLALDGLSELGFEAAVIEVLALVSVVALVVYTLYAARVENALFPLKLFAAPSYRIGLLGNMFARIGSGGMPFLIPLLLQVGLGYSPLHAGLLMIPVAIASIISKPLAPHLISRLTYRRLLIGNTFLVGASILSFSFVSNQYPLAILIAQSTLFGLVSSLQFTAMNTVTLKNLPIELASSGNSLYSMVQMLSMSFGVASAGAMISAFHSRFKQPLIAFHGTFFCMGLITCTSAAIFWQLEAQKSRHQN